jgi:hypothetical protein
VVERQLISGELPSAVAASVVVAAVNVVTQQLPPSLFNPLFQIHGIASSVTASGGGVGIEGVP